MEQARAELIYTLDMYNRGLLECESDAGLYDYWSYLAILTFFIILGLRSHLVKKEGFITVILMSLFCGLMFCTIFSLCYRIGDSSKSIYFFTSSAIRYGCKYKSRVISLEPLYQDKQLFERIYNNFNDYYDRDNVAIIHAISILRALTIENCTT